MPYEENLTRQQIMTLLKKNGPLTVSELSKKMNITHMAVRQHIMHLERKGNIKYAVKNSGIGRPVFQYRLSDNANELFPKAYGNFLSDILNVIENSEGKKKLNVLFRARNTVLIQKYQEILSKGSTVSEKAAILADIMDSDGAMVELKEENGSIQMAGYNCLLQRIVDKYPEICDYELDLYQNLFGKDTVRTQCIKDGDLSCEYKIRKA